MERNVYDVLEERGFLKQCSHPEELRELLGAWRDAKRSVWKALIGWVARMLLALVLVGLAVRLGYAGYVK